MDIQLQQLRHLHAAANSASYAQAAKKGFTSRQNIAHSVRAIEAELGVTLFERKGNVMVLTEEGRKVAPVTEEIIARVDGLRVTFSDRGSAASALSLAVSVNLFAGMPEGVDEVLMRRPGNLQFLEFGCEQCYELVCAGKVDAAIVMCMDRAFPNCNTMRIGGSVAYALVSETSPLARKSGCTASDLVDKTLILMSEPSFQYEPLFTQLDKLGFDRSFASVFPSTSSMIHLVRTREEAVSIPSRKFAANPPRGTVSVPIADSRMNWGFYILYKGGERGTDDVMRLIHDIRKAFEESEVASRYAGA